MKTQIMRALALAALLTTTTFAADNWQDKLAKQLPLLGHRNWIVVVDAAYPLQTAPGIETIYVDAAQLSVVKGVLSELAKTKHVKPPLTKPYTSVFFQLECGYWNADSEKQLREDMQK